MMKTTRSQAVKTEPKETASSKQTIHWTLREKKALAAALQLYGFSDTSKLAKAVRTRDEIAVKHFIDCWTKKLQKDVAAKRRESTTANDLSGQHAAVTSPSIRCWKKIANMEVHPKLKPNDHSSILCDLLEQFYKEEQEPDDPNIPNVKAVYKYLWDCVSGIVPGLLKPIDSALVLLLLRDLRHILNSCDFQEEKEFVQSFCSATKFIPLGVKGEFQAENKKSEVKEEATSSNTAEEPAIDNGAIPIPEELFQELNIHRKVKENINPLGIPLWLLAKEQGIIECYYRNK